MEKDNDDLIGYKIGLLEVMSYYDTKKYGKRYLCKCDCGQEIIRYGTLIRTNRVHSCGCQKGKWNKGKVRSARAVEHIGEQYNMLTIVGYEKNNRKNQYGYLMVCKCKCGNITKQAYADLVNGKVKSCGCYQKEQASKTGSEVGLNNFKNNYEWYFIKDGRKIHCRSGYEVIYAGWLQKNNINFNYEEKCFKLSNNQRYIPDFHILDTDEYVEIKGSFKTDNQENQKNKINIFKLNHKHKTMFWKDIVSVCNLRYKTYITYFRQAKKKNINIEDYLAKLFVA